MNTITFFTNINCGSCVARVTPTLDRLVGEKNWRVDTAVPEKTLQVQSDRPVADEVIQALSAIGFKAEVRNPA